MRTKTQRCTPSICARAICELIRTLQKYALGDTTWTWGRMFSKILSGFRIYKILSFWQFSINSNQNTTLHTFHMCYISLWIDNNTPMYASGDTGWTWGRIFTKRLSNFMNLQSVILTIFHQFDPKHDVAQLQYVL